VTLCDETLRQHAALGRTFPVTLRALGMMAGIGVDAGPGQRPERATEHLAAMQHIPHLWPLTFSFGRALTGPALAAWRGEPSLRAAGQRALAHRVAMNTAALSGHYSPELELDLA
jgi:fructose-bisphosphate aldolase class I